MPKEKKAWNGELRIRNVSESIKEAIDNIADAYGITTPNFLKAQLKKIVDDHPDHMKKPRD